MTGLRQLASCDAVLSRRSRYGDRGAATRLAARHLERVSELAVVVGGPDHSESLARQAFALALRGRRPFEDALVAAFARLTPTTADPLAARGRLLVLLVELEGRSLSEAAVLVGLDPEQVRACLPGARSATGLVDLPRRCRGWGLVSRRGLTDAERQAGQDHLTLCRRCRERLASLDRTRAQLLGGSAGLAGGLAVTALSATGGSTSIAAATGSVIGSKVAAGLVAAAGAIVLAAGGTAAVVQQPPHDAPVSPLPADSLERQPAVGPVCATCSPRPSPTATLLPRLPSAVPTVPGLPVPTASLSAVPLPGVPLPGVPLPALPSALPLPSLPGLPLPTVPSLP